MTAIFTISDASTEGSRVYPYLFTVARMHVNIKPVWDSSRPHTRQPAKLSARLSVSLWGPTRRNGSICVVHTHVQTTHRGIQSNYQAVNDCCASAVPEPFITSASSGPDWARETAYHVPQHLMGLMQPINRHKYGYEVQRAPLPSVRHSVVYFQICPKSIGGLGWYRLLISFIFLREDVEKL